MSENLVKTDVPVRLDGVDYILRYRALAFIKYADECKGDLLHDIRRIGGALTEYSKLASADDDGPAAGAGSIAMLAPILDTIRDVLWAGLIDAQPMIERDEVSRMFGLNDFPALVPVITQRRNARVADGRSGPPYQAGAESGGPTFTLDQWGRFWARCRDTSGIGFAEFSRLTLRELVLAG